MQKDLAEYSFRNIKRRKVRTWLTVLAIVIGIGSFVALVTIGDSFKQTISNELESFGKESIMVMPGDIRSAMSFGPSGSVSTGKLYDKDVLAIESVSGVERVTPLILAPGVEIKHSDESVIYYVMGVPNTLFFEDFPTYNLAKGRGISSSESGVAVIGNSFANSMFSKKLDIGSTLYINDEKFKVIGILEEIGGTFGSEDDAGILVSFKDARKFSENTLEKDEISYVFVKAKTEMNLSKVSEDIKFVLRNLHRVKEGEEDFTIINYDFVVEASDMVLGTFVLALSLIAAISLLVGGIGIMNTMYMSVFERTRELGTLKALGALKKDILMVVLIESGFLGLIGGILGVLIGIGLSILAVFLIGIEIVYNPIILLGSIVLSFLIGLVSGYFPAKRAVDLSPTEALRYE
ncbi:MAG: ABC transporter permease [Candidatus Micrarchaeia archaeon]|jgi:putative ABC transport system permease protein